MVENGQEFSGATMNLEEGNIDKLPDVKFGGGSATPTETISRNRPGSTRSTRSEGSHTTPSNHYLTEFSAQRFFSYRAQQTGLFARAVQATQDQCVKPDEDGIVKGVWLLTEIDHWDNEREKLVLLCQKTLIVVQYDFIRFTILHQHRIPLYQLESIRLGQLTYPNGSFMSKTRDHGGLRISWGKESELKWSQRWNPWCGEIPFTTFAHHPLHYFQKEQETATYNVDDFYEALISATQDAYIAMKPGEKPVIENGEVTINSYASVWSMVFNQSRLGFNKERGGVSY